MDLCLDPDIKSGSTELGCKLNVSIYYEVKMYTGINNSPRWPHTVEQDLVPVDYVMFCGDFVLLPDN